jgi:hypothetical protein
MLVQGTPLPAAARTEPGPAEPANPTVFSCDAVTEIPVGTPLWLQGYGYNLEDGTLEGAALRWRSDRVGDLGTGSQALVTLSPGQHVITLAATDVDGNHATANINVYAGGKIYLPLVVRG